MNTEMYNGICAKFDSLFGPEGSVYQSSGRVNLIGEHTDYNGGFVMPAAIDKCIIAKIRANGTDKVRVFAIDRNEYCEFGLKEEDKPEQSWAHYIFGVCRETAKRGGKVGGFDTVFAGDVPAGAGLSSSAALESTFAYAINDIWKNGFDLMTLAKIGQSTEHNYCGVMCGIMDQFASCFGKKNQLIRLNCKTMEYAYFPFDAKGYKLVLVDSCVKHELASSAYNKRRQSCENACAAIRANHPEVEFLSDAKMEWLDEVKDVITEEEYMRAHYVIGEFTRVLDVCEALEKGDFKTVGERMYGTHYGLSREYEVSCPELDFLNDLAKEMGVTGSRVMGGGFGGCTINLVKDELCDRFIAEAKKRYTEKFGHDPKVYDVVIEDGAHKME